MFSKYLHPTIHSFIHKNSKNENLLPAFFSGFEFFCQFRDSNPGRPDQKARITFSFSPLGLKKLNSCPYLAEARFSSSPSSPSLGSFYLQCLPINGRRLPPDLASCQRKSRRQESRYIGEVNEHKFPFSFVSLYPKICFQCSEPSSQKI